MKKADFVVFDKEGGPTLLSDTITNNRYAASSWLTLSENQVTIAKNSTYTATAFINVPKDAYPCGHYTSVYFEPTSANPGEIGKTSFESGSSVSFRLVSLISIDVGGQCSEKAYISKFSVPGFSEYGPVTVDLELLNKSNYHITPQAYVSLVNIFDNQTDLKALPRYNIFPDATRAYKIVLGQKWMLGRYKVLVSAGYGKTGQNLSGVGYIWIIPWKVIIAGILALIIIILLAKNIYQGVIKKESNLESEIEEEKSEIAKLKELLKKRD